MPKSCPISEDEVLAIHNAKLKEIRGALHDLYVIGIATGLYEKNSIDMDYKTFEKRVKETFEISSGEAKPTFEKFDSVLQEMVNVEQVYIGVKHFNEDQKTAIVHRLLSLDYISPHNWNELADHLTLLKQYYSSHFDNFHPMEEFYFDVSLCKILREIGSFSVIGRLNGNELARIKNIRKALKKRVGKKSTPVSEIFYTDIVKKGMKMHAVAKLIQDEFIKRKNEMKSTVKLRPQVLL